MTEEDVEKSQRRVLELAEQHGERYLLNHINIYIDMYIHIYIYLSIYLSMSIYLSIHLSIYLSLSRYIYREGGGCGEVAEEGP